MSPASCAVIFWTSFAPGGRRKARYSLGMIEEIYYLLMLFDYPDAITHGLRRKSDLARSMLERTRGDLTNALELAKMQESLCSFREPPKE